MVADAYSHPRSMSTLTLSSKSSILSQDLSYQPRIPKLGVRNRVSEPPVLSDHPAYRANIRQPAASPNVAGSYSQAQAQAQPAASALPWLARPGPSPIVSSVSSPSISSSGSVNPAPQRPKKTGVLSYLMLKEPSSNAWEQFAAEEKKKASNRAGSPFSSITKQKLPPTVPKVNSRWDGLPDVARSRSTSNATRTSGTSTRRGSLHVARKSSGSGRHSSGDNQRGSSTNSKASSRPTTSDNKLGQALGSSTSTSSPRTVIIKDDLPQLIPHSIPEYSLFFPPDPPAVTKVENVLPVSNTGIAHLSTNSSSNSESPLAPSTPPNEYDAVGTFYEPSSTEGKTVSHHREKSNDGPQWPLPADADDTSVMLRPVSSPVTERPLARDSPIRTRSPQAIAGQDEEPPRSPLQRLYIRDVSPEPPAQSSVSPPSSPVRVFSRPFNANNSPDLSVATKSPPSSPKADSSRLETGLNLSFDPVSTVPVRQPLVPPRLRPGQVIVKDSDLATIPESDTASILYKAPTGDTQETYYESSSDDQYDSNEDTFWTNDNADQLSIAESHASEMSAQWYQSPRERLGLGSHITWNSSSNLPPWQLSAQTSREELQRAYNALYEDGNGGRKTPTQGDILRRERERDREDKKGKRSSLKDVFKR